MENVAFLEVMRKANTRLKEKRINGVTNQNFSEILMGCIELGSQTNNKDILDNMILHAPTKGEVVDSKEDLSIIANYIESLNMEQAKTR